MRKGVRSHMEPDHVAGDADRCVEADLEKEPTDVSVLVSVMGFGRGIRKRDRRGYQDSSTAASYDCFF
jgi:hypothetical protein